ncbi:MAG: hypothetical protein ACRDQ0_14535 [Pseudonocardia sp.]
MADQVRLLASSARPVTDEQRRAASRLVLRMARSREDLRRLLAMLGLDGEKGGAK